MKTKKLLGIFLTVLVVCSGIMLKAQTKSFISNGVNNDKVNPLPLIADETPQEVIAQVVDTTALCKGSSDQFSGIKTNKIMQIYPNPTTNLLIIEIPQFYQNPLSYKKSNLIISDIAGNELLTENITTWKTQIDISTFRNGVYILKLINDETVEFERVIKK